MSMDPNRLWAKSCPRNQKPRPSMYLLNHLQDVHEAAKRVVDATGDSQLSALGLDPEKYRVRFRRCVLLAAAVHDLGKANDHFQGMLLWSADRRDKPQGLRHEWVTMLMLKSLREWLLQAVGGDEIDSAIVEWAVAGHHPAHNHESPPRNCPTGGPGVEIKLRMGHKDFTPVLVWLQAEFGGAIPALSDVTRKLVNADNVYLELSAWARAAQQLWQKRVENTDGAKLVAAVKNCLIAADVAGSALPKDGDADWDRITRAFRTIPPADDLAFLAKYGLEGSPPRDFQTEVAEHPDEVVFVKAGCGTGKTVAAYMRAANRWAGRRLYFCYPTTGTATEGFKDYLHPEMPEKPAGDTPEKAAERTRLIELNTDLFHSRSGVDFEIILTNGSDSKSADADAAAKADALESWSTPIVACTVDTVLGIVQNNRRGLFGWPALAQSAFVFDEIHAYDDRLFGALLRFLRDLPGLPCLLMTASLPTPREEALRDVLKRFRGIELKPITGPEDLETLARYRKAQAADSDPLPQVVETIKAGGKVLWVCNTVKRVMAAADAAEAAGLTPMIYHSRFKYIDRVQRHKAVIDAFDRKKNAGPALAICSQVAEMSLDLSADLLVTDVAPVPALIQRLGRLNRKAVPAPKGHEPPETKPFLVVEPENNLPYTPDDLTVAKAWLDKLSADGISQRHLAEAWKQTSVNPPDLVPSAWLDGGPTTTVTELREASPGITVLLRGDVEKIRKSSDIGRYTLPMPPPPKSVDWRSEKYKGIPVVPTESVVYDELRGAQWQK